MIFFFLFIIENKSRHEEVRAQLALESVRSSDWILVGHVPYPSFRVVAHMCFRVDSHHANAFLGSNNVANITCQDSEGQPTSKMPWDLSFNTRRIFSQIEHRCISASLLRLTVAFGARRLLWMKSEAN